MANPNPIPDAALTQHTIVRPFGPAPAIIVPTDMDKAYAAGFFDGEGNVCIASNKSGGHDRSRLVYNMRLGASQCNPEPLYWLLDRWGGSFRQNHYGNGAGVSDGYIWQCFSLGAAAFLRDVLPYLQVKRKRAELALRFQATTFQPGRRAHTPAWNVERAAMKAEMNRLNRPGVTA